MENIQKTSNLEYFITNFSGQRRFLAIFAKSNSIEIRESLFHAECYLVPKPSSQNDSEFQRNEICAGRVQSSKLQEKLDKLGFWILFLFFVI